MNKPETRERRLLTQDLHRRERDDPRVERLAADIMTSLCTMDQSSETGAYYSRSIPGTRAHVDILTADLLATGIGENIVTSAARIALGQRLEDISA
ncbi:MAG: hypothetical protein WC498_01905 [Candidatus Saccharimonadales bacterium]